MIGIHQFQVLRQFDLCLNDSVYLAIKSRSEFLMLLDEPSRIHQQNQKVPSFFLMVEQGLIRSMLQTRS